MRHSFAINKEWGRKARKEWDRLGGLNNADRRLAIADQLYPPQCQNGDDNHGWCCALAEPDSMFCHAHRWGHEHLEGLR